MKKAVQVQSSTRFLIFIKEEKKEKNGGTMISGRRIVRFKQGEKVLGADY